MAEQYTSIARFYDALQSEFDYGAYADFAIEMCRRFGFEPKTALDLACGTGNIAIELAERGLDVTATDLSEDMLAKAAEKVAQSGLDILLLHQDMRELDLNDTVDMAVCALDSINYLLDTKSILETFKRVELFLTPGGVFVFDIDSKFKFENVYANRDYVLEADGVLCAWQNCYNKKRGICDFLLSFFAESEDGSYRRYDEFQRERCYSTRTIEKLLREAGLELCGIFGEKDMSEVKSESERIFFAAKKQKS